MNYFWHCWMLWFIGRFVQRKMFWFMEFYSCNNGDVSLNWHCLRNFSNLLCYGMSVDVIGFRFDLIHPNKSCSIGIWILIALTSIADGRVFMPLIHRRVTSFKSDLSLEWFWKQSFYSLIMSDFCELVSSCN